MTRPQRRCLAVILGVALAVRMGWALVQPTSAASIDRLPDQREYLNLAGSLREHGSLQLFDARFGQTVLAYRLPGYPIFLAAFDNSIVATRLVQAAIDTSTVLAAFLLARDLSGSLPVALCTATAVAANPFLTYFSGLLLTETVFVAAVVWGTVAACHRKVPAAIALYILAAYLRPPALILAPALTLFATNCRGRSAYHWRPALLVVIAFACSLMPWMVRNRVRLGAVIWTTTNDGVTFYDGFHDGATGGSDQRFVADQPGLRTMNEVERSRRLSALAWGWAVAHPTRLPELSLRKIARGWSPVPLSPEFGRPLYRWIGATFAVPLDLLCIVGLGSKHLTRRAKVLLLTPAVLLTAVQVMTVGSIRYRLPAEPFLAVLAGAGAADLWQRVRRRPGWLDDQDHAAASDHPPSPV